jgi:poly(3-hydroxybutyrate) depolymerase
MPTKPSVQASELSLMSVPAFWPMALLEESKGTELYAKNLKFVEEEIKIHEHLRPNLATANQVRFDLRTMLLRDYGKPGGIPTLVDAALPILAALTRAREAGADSSEL